MRRMERLEESLRTLVVETSTRLPPDVKRAMSAALGAVLEFYQGRTLADRPDGSRRVRVMSLAMPHRRR